MRQRLILYFALPVIVFLAFLTLSLVIGGSSGLILRIALLETIDDVLLFALLWSALPVTMLGLLQMLAKKRQLPAVTLSPWSKLSVVIISMSAVIVAMNWAYRFSSDIRLALLLMSVVWLVLELAIFNAYKHQRSANIKAFGYKVQQLLTLSIFSALWLYLLVMPVLGFFYFIA